MTPYFHNGIGFKFLEFLSTTLARYTGSGFHLHIKIRNYVKDLSITFQNLTQRAPQFSEPLKSPVFIALKAYFDPLFLFVVFHRYNATEIGARNFTDTCRYNLMKVKINK